MSREREVFPPGTAVRVRAGDPPGHTRAPGYVRGQVGEVVAQHGEHPLPDDVVAGAAQPPVVRFGAVGPVFFSGKWRGA